MKGDIWRLQPAEVTNSHSTRVVEMGAWQLTNSGWCLLLSSETITGRFEILQASQDWFLTDTVIKINPHGYSGESTGPEAVDGWLMSQHGQSAVLAGIAQVYQRPPQEILMNFIRWREKEQDEVQDQ